MVAAQPGNEVLTTVESGILDAARRHGVADRVAREMATAVEELLRIEHGGGRSYIAAVSVNELREAARQDRISGMGYGHLARKYRRSVATIRRWVD